MQEFHAAPGRNQRVEELNLKPPAVAVQRLT